MSLTNTDSTATYKHKAAKEHCCIYVRSTGTLMSAAPTALQLPSEAGLEMGLDMGKMVLRLTVARTPQAVVV